jgi:hypothetical protein
LQALLGYLCPKGSKEEIYLIYLYIPAPAGRGLPIMMVGEFFGSSLLALSPYLNGTIAMMYKLGKNRTE